LALAVGVIVLFGKVSPVRPPAAEVSYTDFNSMVAKGDVLEVVLRGSKIEATLRDPITVGPARTSTDRVTTLIPAIGDPELLGRLEDSRVVVRVQDAEPEAMRPLLGLLPWLLFIAVYFWLWRRMSQGIIGGFGRGGEIGRFLEGSVRTEKTRPRVTFADVAGQDNAKREVAELVDYLRNPERYTRLGAEVPHGILLMGPPGTGKTLLARALAGEAEVPFFSISASEFIEVFVGVGASRVRRMFAEAKEKAPSIIFIDELDAVGRTRGTGLGGGHDEREQTLNQILAEMDGFAGHEAVIVLAATNRPDVLDPALLRPGRFDRHVTLDLPDRKAREEILRVHVRKVPLAQDVELAVVAAGTPGFSGADLRNLVNEAAMAAARESAEQVSKRHFDEMRDRLLLGAARTLVIQPDERHRMAVHEAGHTIAACHLTHADPVQKVTIIPRGRSLGATQQLPEEDRHTLPEEYLRDRLCVLLAGRAAERQMLRSISSGADDDIRLATALARAMVTRWGMSEQIGPVDVRDSDEHPFLGRDIALPRRFSETVAHAVDEAVRDMLREAEQRAAEIIQKNRAAMTRLIAALEEHETLERSAIDACLAAAETPRQARAGS
jgi:cell division protease FtsH